MKVHCANAVLCDFVKDPLPGLKKDLVGVVGGVKLRNGQQPVLGLWLYARLMLEGEVGETGNVVVTVTPPGAEPVELLTVNLRVDGGSISPVEFSAPLGFAAPAAGFYTFRLLVGDQSVASVMLEVLHGGDA